MSSDDEGAMFHLELTTNPDPTSNSPQIRCTTKGCTQVFHSIETFQRHIMQSHIILDQTTGDVEFPKR